MTQEDCALCGYPMNPGQRRTELKDGTKAHSSCAAMANTTVGITEIREIMHLDDAEAVQAFRTLVAAIVDDAMADAVATATKDTIHSKANDLRDLMLHAAEHLDRGIDKEAKGSYPNVTALIGMTKAAAVLRTVAIYIKDDPAP